VKRVSDVASSGEFYPDLPRVKFDELVDKDVVVHDITERKGDKGEYLLIALAEDGKSKVPTHTTICGGVVIVRKLKECAASRAFPLLATITQPEDYYDIN